MHRRAAIQRVARALLTPSSSAALAFSAPPPRPVEELSWPDAFERRAVHDPDAVAVVCEDVELSYGQLAQRARRLARTLIARGVVQEDIVAVAAPRSADMVVALLGVMRAGCAYLPLDLDHPPDRIAYMLRDCGARIVVTVSDLAPDLPAIEGLQALRLDDPPECHDDVDLPGPLALERAAYVIYTSGSTGHPKGVVVSHEGIGSLVATAVDRLGVDARSRVAQFASVGFDVAVWDLCMTLGVGGCAVIVPAPRRVAGAALTEYLAQQRVTHMILPPSLVAALPPDCPLPAGAVLVVGTETVPAELVARWSRRMRVVVAYGLTEATVNSTLWPAEPGWDGPVPIGRPDPNTRTYVLDADLRPAAVGAVGELYVGGRGLARGYLGRPRLTSERFVADPFGVPGSRMYRTGDLARWRTDGALDFVGRSDGQVKIRGHRIEPGEIEAVLLRHPDVAQAAVIAREDEPGAKRLVGYAVASAGPLDPADLRAHVADRLPEHMVPAAVVVLDGPLPLTPNGKLDRAALPAPDFSTLTGSDEPRTSVEHTLAALFARTLGLPRVGIHDDFFALGGDSIVAIGLVSLARQAKLVLRPRDIFEQRTVAALAGVAQEREAPPIVAARDGLGRVAPTPIMHWLRELGGSIGGFYQSLVLQAPAGLDRERLAVVVQALLDRHDLLRARLRRDDGWSLEVPPPATVQAAELIEVVDVRDAGHDMGGAVAAWSAAAAARLDPDGGRMVQVVWLHAGRSQPGRVLLLVHHAVVDGVSLRILMDDLADAWDAVLAVREPQLDAVGTSFRRWAQLLSQAGHSGARAGELERWRQSARTSDPPLGARPLDRRRDLVASSRTLTVSLPAEQTATLLTTLPALYGATVNDVLLTALAVAVARWRDERGRGGGTDVLVDLEGHGREDVFDDVDLARTVGWFTTLFPVGLDAGTVDWAALRRGEAAAGRALRRVKEQLRALPDRGLGFGILRHLDPQARAQLAAAPVPQVLFNYLGRFPAQDGTPWTPVREAPPLSDVRDPHMPMGHTLDIDAVVRDADDGPALSTTFAWPREIFTEAEIAALAQLWLAALGGLHAHAADPAAGGHTPSDFPFVMLDQAEVDGFEAAVPVLQDVLPATALQEGFFFHAHADAQDIYVVQQRIDLDGPLDATRLRAAVTGLLERHAPLRAGFRRRPDGHVVQLIASGLEVSWREIDLRGEDAHARAARAAALAAEERGQRFDLAHPPLMRCTLISLDDNRHRLLLTLRHILADGWSESVIVRDLLALYAGDRELPAITPYRRYFGWLAEQDRGAAAAAWRAALDGLDGPTKVAEGEPAIELRFEVARAELSEQLTASLVARVREHGVTLSTALQVAWGLVLGQLAGREDVVFGTTVSGRPPDIAGIENLAGLFINTLPVRVHWRAGQPLADVLVAHQLAQADLLDHQHLGLAEIQRLTGRRELFDTLLMFENQPPTQAVGRVARGLEVTAFETLDFDHYPLALTGTPGPRLALALKHDVDGFVVSEARRIIARVVAVLEAVVAEPERPAGRVELLSEAERASLLDGWTGPALEIEEQTLQAAFAAQAARTPDATALIDGGASLTYAQLAARATELAQRLRAAGAGPEQLVAVAIPRSAQLIVALLGVLEAGATYLPLDPSHPAARRAFVLEDSGARLVVARAEDAWAQPQVEGVRVIALDADGAVAAPEAVATAAASTGANVTGAAYCIYTSGSTGRPKGVVVSHRAILSHLAWIQRTLPLRRQDRVMTRLATSFDVSLLEMLWPLYAGATIVVAPGDAHRDPVELAGLTRKHGVTVLVFTPSTLDAFLRATEDQAPPASLRMALSVGEELRGRLADRWRDQTAVALFNIYGPTEATIVVTCWEHGGGGERVLIGPPAANTGLRILDAGLRPVAPRVAGELYLAGTQLARGYHGRPGLTAQRFVADPFGAPGERMYRTGDLVRDRGDGDGDGAIEYLGRTDHQVKIRGNRVELGEIEARLLDEDGVAAAVAVVRSDGPGGARLVAYAAAATGGRPDGETLRATLAAQLPEPMVPSAVVVLDELPMSPAGKVDRAALPAPAAERRAARAPADERERLLCDTFADVLGLEQVGPDEDFFVLGGDSILSISVSIGARRAGLELAPRDVFRERTPAALARRAAAATPPQAPEPAADAEGVGAVTPLPIVHHLRECGGPIGRFNLSALVQVPAGTRLEQLAAVLQAILDHHDGLRLRRNRIAGVLWSLETLPVGAVPAAELLRRIDVAGDDRQALLAAIATQSDAAVGRLDPDAGRMLDAVWFDAGAHAPGRLLLATHHLAVDGVSWRILLGDLAQAWEAVRAGGAPALDPVATSLRTFAALVDEEARAPRRLAELEHWQATLAAGAELIAGASQEATTAQCVAHTIELSARDTEPLLTTAPAAAGGDVTELLLAALRVAVSRWHTDRGGDASADLLVDLERHGREPVAAGTDLSRTVGWLTTIHPVRLRAGADPLDALRRVRDCVRSAPDGGIGFGMLRYANAQVAPLLARAPRPQILFNYYGRFPARQARDWTPAPESDALAVAPDGALGVPYLLQLDIVCDDEPAGPRLRATWTRTEDGLSARDVEQLQQAWLDALRELAAVKTGAAAARLEPADLTTVSLTREQIDRVQRASPSAVEDIWRLSPLQEGLYFHSTFDEGELDVYTAQTSLDFARGIDVERLRAACAALLARHASLRAGFTSDGLAQPVQFIARDPQTPIDTVDLTDLETVAQRRRLSELMSADRTRRFDLARPPLLRMLVVRLGDGRDRLVITNHLVLWDGWSQGIFRDQLLELYERGGDDAGLAPAGSYRDYLAWLSAQDQARAAAAWRDALADLKEATLVGPADRAPAPVIPDSCRSALSSELTARVRRAAARQGVTLNTVLTAAWGLVLACELGRDDVVFGVTVTERPAGVAGVQDAIGMFINTVPVRVRLDPREPVGDLLARMQSERVALMEHDHLGLGPIQRETGHAQLFDTLFVLQSFAGGDDAALEQIRERFEVEIHDYVDATHFPLTLIVSPGARLRVMLEHRPDLFDRQAAEALLARLETVLEQLAADASAATGSLDLLTAQEVEQLEASCGSIGEPVGQDTVGDLLDEQSQRSPDTTALVCGEESLTYAELSARINRLARLLIERGAGPEEIVALALPRSPEMVIALFAVLATGAAYLPLDLDHPADRLALMLDDAGPLLLLTTSNGEASLRADGVERVLLDDRAVLDILRALPDGLLADAERPAFARSLPHRLEHLAYVIYTSGSTGRPKGVATAHRGLTNMQLNHRREIFDPVVAAAGGRRLRIAHTVSFSFDMSWEELLWLVEGHELHVCDEALRRDAEALVAYCDRHRIDVVNVTPTYAHHLIEQGLLENGSGDAGHRPALVLLGGEAVPDGVWSRLRDTDGTLGYNLYGPTEYTINALGAGTADSASPTIGRPIRSTRAYVLDGALRRAPVGAPGELYLAGVGLARGYQRSAGRTAERFVADPYAAEHGARMYRTGDLVRLRADGNVDYLGRTDDQVKIRGHRVELGEIEAALAGQEGVAQAAVVAQPGAAPAGPRLFGYAVVPEAEPDAGVRLRAALRQSLPEYMVPAAVAVLERLPLTVNGKLDVRALPVPEISSGAPQRAPSSHTEEVLCELFAAILEVDSVGVLDSFFELGGHSLLATRLVSRARAELGVELSIRDLFEAPTVEELARRAGGGADARARPQLVARERPARVALSSAQRRLWLLSQDRASSAAYNYPLLLRLRGELDVDALQSAIGDVVARHEVLRTRIAEDQGEPWQDVGCAEQAHVAFERVDSDAELARALSRPFDLATELPLRVSYRRRSSQEHVVLVLLHHIATDEWSDAPFVRDLATAYDARRRGSAPGWDPLPVQYADYTLWQEELLGAEDDPASLAGEQLAYWHAALEGAPAELELGADRPPPSRPSHRGGAVEGRLPAAALQELAQQTGTSLFMVLQAAVAVLLHRHGAGDDIPLGAPIAGRTSAALEDLVGFFVNTLVLRCDLSGDPTFRELLARVREMNLSAFDHQDVPFERVVQALNPERALGRNPLFDVMVVHRAAPAQTARFADLVLEDEPLPTHSAKFDLAFVFAQTGGDDVECLVEFSADRFDRPTAERLLARLGRLVAAVTANPDARIAAVDGLGDEERGRVLRRFNATQRDVEPLTLPELFARHAERSPDALALVAGDERLTYAQLDARAATLAAGLSARGVGPESVVAVALARTAQLVVALLAVQQAGGAHLALDMEHPRDRLAYVLADSGARFVLTDAARATLLPDVAGVEPLVLDAGERPALDTVVASPASGPPPPLRPDHPAYVIYTSGSTGRPKGVAVTHGGLASLLATAQDRMGVVAASRVLQFASVSFDVAVFDLVMALGSGARLVLVPQEQRVADAPLTDLMREEGVTHAILPPSLLATLPDHRQLPEGMTLLVGTETVPPQLIARLVPRLRVFAAYGLTETTVNSTLWEAQTGWGDRAIPIGRPDPNTRVHVLDAALRPLGVGMPGELYVAGDGLARGYVGRAGLTAERFVACPFGPAGARMYRTGDRARWRADGQLEFLGRSDDQLKLRGVRVEPAEIEAALYRHPQVAQAAVVLHGERLIAYTAPQDVDEQALRAHCAQLLPPAMIPASFVTRDALPVGPSGKLDRGALLALTPDAEASRAPRGADEHALACLFSEVLGIPEPVAATSSFFALGGHSLVGMRLIGRVRAELGAELTIRDLFEMPTVEGLARRLSKGGPARPPLLAAPRPAVLPMSPAQERLWRLARADGGRSHHLPLALRLPGGALDARALEAALADVVARHEGLRTIYGEQDGRPVQRVLDPAAAPIVLERQPVGEPGLAAALAAITARPFDLAAAPPVRVTLLDDGPRGQVLLLVRHEIAADEWSVVTLVADLAQAYAARLEDVAPALQALPVQPADHALWLRDLLGDASDPASRLARQLAWWRGSLAGLPEEISLGTARPLARTTDDAGASVEFELDGPLHRALRAVGRTHGASLFMVLQTALAIVLTDRGAGRDLPIAALVAGREEAVLDDVVGSFANLVILRTDTSGGGSFGELLARVRDNDLAALDHAEAPYDVVVQAAGRSRAPQVLIVHHQAARLDPLGGHTLELEAVPTGSVPHDLVLSFYEGAPRDPVECVLEYRCACIDAATARDLVDGLVAVLRDAAGEAGSS